MMDYPRFSTFADGRDGHPLEGKKRRMEEIFNLELLITAFRVDPSESAQLSPPVSAGILSISAFTQVSATMANQIVNYQISLSVAEGIIYTFDFSTGKIV
jgi:hypothetical protein